MLEEVAIACKHFDRIFRNAIAKFELKIVKGVSKSCKIPIKYFKTISAWSISK